MGQLERLASQITASLGTDPLLVDRHIRGLKAAGRLGGEIDATDCADLLLCCLGFNAGNATEPHHLPFIGALHLDEEDVTGIDIGDPMFTVFDGCFSGMVATIIEHLATGRFSSSHINFICVSRQGGEPDGVVGLNESLFPGPGAWLLFYGYDLLRPFVKRRLSFAEPHLLRMNMVPGHLLAEIAASISGAANKATATAYQEIPAAVH